MRYRSFQDRKISTYAALVIVLIFGISATTLILHAISVVKFDDTNLAKIVN